MIMSIFKIRQLVNEKAVIGTHISLTTNILLLAISRGRYEKREKGKDLIATQSEISASV